MKLGEFFGAFGKKRLFFSFFYFWYSLHEMIFPILFSAAATERMKDAEAISNRGPRQASNELIKLMTLSLKLNLFRNPEMKHQRASSTRL